MHERNCIDRVANKTREEGARSLWYRFMSLSLQEDDEKKRKLGEYQRERTKEFCSHVSSQNQSTTEAWA
jgi:hypothetical protein